MPDNGRAKGRDNEASAQERMATRPSDWEITSQLTAALQCRAKCQKIRPQILFSQMDTIARKGLPS